MGVFVLLDGEHGEIAVNPDEVLCVEPASKSELEHRGFFDTEDGVRRILTKVTLKHPRGVRERWVNETVAQVKQKLNGEK